MTLLANHMSAAAPGQTTCAQTPPIQNEFLVLQQQLHNLATGQQRLEDVLTKLNQNMATFLGNSAPYCQSRTHMSLDPNLPQGAAYVLSGPESDDNPLPQSFSFKRLGEPLAQQDQEQEEQHLPCTASSSQNLILSARDDNAFSQHHSTRTTIRTWTQDHGRLGIRNASVHQSQQTSWTRNLHPVHPNGKIRMSFDMLSMLVLMFDSLLVPFELAWVQETTQWVWFKLTSLATLLFWTADLLLGFATGYYNEDGDLVMDFKTISSHYFRRQFIVDFFVILSDWAGTASTFLELNRSHQFIKLVRIMKLNRIMRLATMARSGKIAQLYDRALQRASSYGCAEHLRFSLSICKLMLLILWLNHLGCCMWHTIGVQSAKNWQQMQIGQAVRQGNETVQDNLFYEYLLGFYWSMTSMVSGASIMAPTTKEEMLFTILFVLFGLIFGSSLISSLAAMLMEFQMSGAERTQQLKKLRRYLYENDASMIVSVPVEKEVMSRLNTARRLTEKEVGLLQLVSPRLRAELRQSIYGAKLKKNKFLRACHALDTAFLVEICLHSLQYEAHDPGERIFEPDTLAEGAFLVHFGSLEYQFGFGAQKTLELIKESTFVAELAIWTAWRHRGWCEALMQCELVKLRAETFHRVLQQSHPDVQFLARDYGKAICNILSMRNPQDQNDIWIGFEHDSMVVCMPKLSRVLMSKPAVDVLFQNKWGNLFHAHAKNMEDLIDEVEAGKCDLSVDDSGNVHRVVLVVTARLQDPSGRLLVQVGKFDEFKISHLECELPGTKVRANEIPKDSFMRLVTTKLRPFRDLIEIKTTQTETYTEKSKAYGINTKYSKTTFQGTVQPRNNVTLQASVARHVGSTNQLCEDDFFLVADAAQKHTHTIFCWMYETLFEDYCSSKNEVRMQHYLSGLDFERLQQLIVSCPDESAGSEHLSADDVPDDIPPSSDSTMWSAVV